MSEPDKNLASVILAGVQKKAVCTGEKLSTLNFAKDLSVVEVYPKAII